MRHRFIGRPGSINVQGASIFQSIFLSVNNPLQIIQFMQFVTKLPRS